MADGHGMVPCRLIVWATYDGPRFVAQLRSQHWRGCAIVLRHRAPVSQDTEPYIGQLRWKMRRECLFRLHL